MQIAVDASGFYELGTGEPVELFYDQQTGMFYNALTGESAELIGDAVNAARDTLIGIFGSQGYPQTRQQYPNQLPNRNQFPNQLPNQSGSLSPGTVSGQGIYVKHWALLAAGVVGVVGVVALMTGRRIR